MMRMKKRPQYNVQMLSNFPSCKPMFYAGHSYLLCSKLEIGYFALSSGRLAFLPSEQEGVSYKIYQKAE